MKSWKNILTAVLGISLAIAIYLTRGKATTGQPVEENPATTLVLDPAFGCSIGYSNGGGQKLEVADSAVVWIELDSLRSDDTTVSTFNMQLERSEGIRWVPEGGVKKVAKKARWQAFPYRGLASGQYRVAFWRDSTDCESGVIRSAENGVLLVARARENQTTKTP